MLKVAFIQMAIITAPSQQHLVIVFLCNMSSEWFMGEYMSYRALCGKSLLSNLVKYYLKYCCTWDLSHLKSLVSGYSSCLAEDSFPAYVYTWLKVLLPLITIHIPHEHQCRSSLNYYTITDMSAKASYLVVYTWAMEAVCRAARTSLRSHTDYQMEYHLFFF